MFAQGFDHFRAFNGHGPGTEGGEIVADRAQIAARAILNDHAGGNLLLVQDQPEHSPAGQGHH